MWQWLFETRQKKDSDRGGQSEVSEGGWRGDVAPQQDRRRDKQKRLVMDESRVNVNVTGRETGRQSCKKLQTKNTDLHERLPRCPFLNVGGFPERVTGKESKC